MVKFCELSTVYNYTWQQVAKGFWSKYPNSFSSHVLSEDTLEAKLVDGKLYTKRLLVKTNSMPRWAEFFYKGRRNVYIVEEAMVDPHAQTLTTYRRNVDLKGFMEVAEKNILTPGKGEAGTTDVLKQAWILCPLRGISYAAQKFGLDRYKSNAVKSDKGFLSVLCRLYDSPALTSAQRQSDYAPAVPSTSASLLQETLLSNASKVRERSDRLVQRANQLRSGGVTSSLERSGEFIKDRARLLEDRARRAAQRAKEERKEVTELFKDKSEAFIRRSRAKADFMKNQARLPTSILKRDL